MAAKRTMEEIISHVVHLVFNYMLLCIDLILVLRAIGLFGSNVISHSLLKSNPKVYRWLFVKIGHQTNAG